MARLCPSSFPSFSSSLRSYYPPSLSSKKDLVRPSCPALPPSPRPSAVGLRHHTPLPAYRGVRSLREMQSAPLQPAVSKGTSAPSSVRPRATSIPSEPADARTRLRERRDAFTARVQLARDRMAAVSQRATSIPSRVPPSGTSAPSSVSSSSVCPRATSTRSRVSPAGTSAPSSVRPRATFTPSVRPRATSAEDRAQRAQALLEATLNIPSSVPSSPVRPRATSTRSRVSPAGTSAPSSVCPRATSTPSGPGDARTHLRARRVTAEARAQRAEALLEATLASNAAQTAVCKGKSKKSVRFNETTTVLTVSRWILPWRDQFQPSWVLFTADQVTDRASGRHRAPPKNDRDDEEPPFRFAYGYQRVSSGRHHRRTTEINARVRPDLFTQTTISATVIGGSTAVRFATTFCDTTGAIEWRFGIAGGSRGVSCQQLPTWFGALESSQFQLLIPGWEDMWTSPSGVWIFVGLLGLSFVLNTWSRRWTCMDNSGEG
ncbi:hypothetical protein BP00DRAFT_482444 [Aspergillus indologenus CBS 114.80]|uniref:Uncharacterized protein n=1 Tax=Aspergillus indologenus CBS 114.80 TaxID=1450541 RepID=A0A2V5HYL6_9EURO|nr:hypothetical protein BP00DRAFT_482444 [Aspergillus indologenus CBS 114.80]